MSEKDILTGTWNSQLDTIRYSQGRIKKFLEDLPGWAQTYSEKLKGVEVETRVNYLTYLNVFLRFVKDYGLSEDILSYDIEQLDKLSIVSMEVKTKIYRNLMLILNRLYN
jgi:hypothetical protein